MGFDPIALATQLATMAADVRQIREGLGTLTATTEAKVTALEARVRELEHKVWKIAGAVAAAGATGMGLYQALFGGGG